MFFISCSHGGGDQEFVTTKTDNIRFVSISTSSEIAYVDHNYSTTVRISSTEEVDHVPIGFFLTNDSEGSAGLTMEEYIGGTVIEKVLPGENDYTLTFEVNEKTEHPNGKYKLYPYIDPFEVIDENNEDDNTQLVSSGLPNSEIEISHILEETAVVTIKDLATTEEAIIFGDEEADGEDYGQISGDIDLFLSGASSTVILEFCVKVGESECYPVKVQSLSEDETLSSSLVLSDLPSDSEISVTYSLWPDGELEEKINNNISSDGLALTLIATANANNTSIANAVKTIYAYPPLEEGTVYATSGSGKVAEIKTKKIKVAEKSYSIGNSWVGAGFNVSAGTSANPSSSAWTTNSQFGFSLPIRLMKKEFTLAESTGSSSTTNGDTQSGSNKVELKFVGKTIQQWGASFGHPIDIDWWSTLAGPGFDAPLDVGPVTMSVQASLGLQIGYTIAIGLYETNIDVLTGPFLEAGVRLDAAYKNQLPWWLGGYNVEAGLRFKDSLIRDTIGLKLNNTFNFTATALEVVNALSLANRLTGPHLLVNVYVKLGKIPKSWDLINLYVGHHDDQIANIAKLTWGLELQ